MSYPTMSTSVPWSLVKNGFHKTPTFEDGTLTSKAPTGHRSSLSIKPYATWAFSLDLEMVLGGEQVAGSVLQDFLGCFLATCGGAGFFLFTDPNDNIVGSSGQGIMLNVTSGATTPMGKVGDGTSTKFQLARSVGQGTDIVQYTSNQIFYVNDTAATATVDTLGVVTFQSAPAVGASLNWSGEFQYLCQFTEDTLKDLARVSKNASGWLWSCGSIEFESVFV